MRSVWYKPLPQTIQMAEKFTTIPTIHPVKLATYKARRLIISYSAHHPPPSRSVSNPQRPFLQSVIPTLPNAHSSGCLRKQIHPLWYRSMSLPCSTEPARAVSLLCEKNRRTAYGKMSHDLAIVILLLHRRPRHPRLLHLAAALS